MTLPHSSGRQCLANSFIPIGCFTTHFFQKATRWGSLFLARRCSGGQRVAAIHNGPPGLPYTKDMKHGMRSVMQENMSVSSMGVFYIKHIIL